MKAILYVAHGSRRESWNEEFVTFIKKVMMLSAEPIQGFGFLEQAEPSIERAVEACIARGATEITLVPIFLLPGVHVNQDLPAICSNYSEVTFRIANPLGVDAIMVEILHDRLRDAGYSNHPDEIVLLVGHGSREPAAKREFEKLASLLDGDIDTAYLTTPNYYDEMVEKLADKKIFLLPYLLYSGGFTTKMKKNLAAYGEQIVFCREVGFDEKIMPLILKRLSEV